MKRPAKIAVALLALAGLAGGVVAANLQHPSAGLRAASVWIGPTLDSDRAVNALPDAQAVAPARSADPAKAQMAISPANAGPESILPRAASGSVQLSAGGDTKAAGTVELPPALVPPPVTGDQFAPPAAAKPDDDAVTIAQATLPAAPQPIAAPAVPPAPEAPAPRPAQMTRPPLDASPAPSAAPAPETPAPATAASTPQPANSLAGGAVFTGTSGRDLNIEINRGALIRLRAPADTVFVANPDIA
ncbi:MAG: hypothetical protein AB7R90_05985, partial [Reyranellaceae bacterium]